MKLDPDIKTMSHSARGQELQRVRKLIRTHMGKKDNARCWLIDEHLYERALPEGVHDPGRMKLSFEVLIGNCARYIKGQQCDMECPLKNNKKTSQERK